MQVIMEALYPEKQGHENNFDFLRFILATTVVFCHSYVIYYGNVDQEPLWVWSENQLSLGTLAINFFFVISGFLVTQSWDRNADYLAFLRKRILRIYPGFIAVCAACAFLFAPLGLGIFRPFYYVTEYWSSINITSLFYRILTFS